MQTRGIFRVEPFTNPSGEQVFRVSGTKADGKRIRENFPTKGEALDRKHELEKESEGIAITTRLRHTWLTEEQLREAERVVLELNGKSALKAARFFMENYSDPVKAKSVRDACQEFYAQKTKGNRRPDTIRDYKDRVGILEETHGDKLVSDILPDHLEPLIQRDAKSARTLINNHSKLNSFFIWAMKKGYTQKNPMADQERPTADREKPAVLTLADVRRLLRAASTEEGGAALPYVALGLFAGIRPTELSRLTWDNIDFHHKAVSITAAIAKKRGVRDVAMSDNLIKFLLPHAVRKTPIKPKNWRRIWDRVRIKAGFGTEDKKQPNGLKPWIQDGMRHTGISHHYRKHSHEGETARWAGNTPDVIHTYYKNLVKEKDNKDFWSISPASLARNVVPLSKAA